MDDDLTPAGSWREDDWSWWRPGEKVSYPIIFPEMDDEPYEEGDHYYDAEEFYCVTPGCTCREVDVAFFDLADADEDEEWMVGTVTLDASTGQSLRMQGEKGGEELLGRLFLAYQSRMAGRPGLLMEQPYATFDLNDYSVPHRNVRRTLTVLATEETVRILDGNEVVATHRRSYDKWQQVEDPAHLAELTDWKRAARRHRGMNRLHSAVPSTGELYRQAAQQGGNLGALTNGLLRLLELFGKTDLEKAVAKAVAHGRPHLPAIRQVLNELEDAKEALPALPVKLPDDPRVRDLVVTPHSLQGYDNLGGGDSNETE